MQKRILVLWDSTRALSPVLGVVLMLLLTILLAGITVSAVYGDEIETSLSGAPMACIKVEHVEGGMPNPVRFNQNYLYLVHEGGDSLPVGSTQIVISGEGSSHTSNFIGGLNLYGDVLITYDNLLYDGKESAYASRNSVLSDGEWSAGEELILNGQDAISGGSSSSVFVTVDGFTGTSNNYGLKESKMITIKIFDSETQRLISECECKVVPAE